MNAVVDNLQVVNARGLRKAYKNKVALDGASFRIDAGRIREIDIGIAGGQFPAFTAFQAQGGAADRLVRGRLGRCRGRCRENRLGIDTLLDREVANQAPRLEFGNRRGLFPPLGGTARQQKQTGQRCKVVKPIVHRDLPESGYWIRRL